MTAAARPSGPRFLRGELMCPSCGNDELEAVTDGTQTNFLCHGCWSCWHPELGYMEPVPATTGPGCAHREDCVRHQGDMSLGDSRL